MSVERVRFLLETLVNGNMINN